MKVRPASSFMSFDESMEHVKEFQSRAELIEFLKAEWLAWKADSVVAIEPWGYDERIGWRTHLLTIDGKAALFTDGPDWPEGN